jgi:hypothetical protein
MKRKTKPLLIAASLSTVVYAGSILLAGEGALAGEKLKRREAKYVNAR